MTNNIHPEKKNNRIMVFRLILAAIPIVFFILLELTLRLVNYGQSLPLFIDTPGSKNYILARPDIIKRYFPNGNNVPSVTLEANLFLKKKPKNGLRIFVQGGSTAAGFPYGFGASPAGMLDQRLSRTFTDRTVEVINTSMSAINSYTLLDFVDEIIEQKPDAVLIYAGHNEFLGILGVGSNYTAASSYSANLIFLKFRKYRTFQLLQNTYAMFKSLTNANKTTDGNKDSDTLKHKRTMMAKVAKQKIIKEGSDIYKQGLKQFENNMKVILTKYQKANIPVLISTLASNLKDQVPFSSTTTSDSDRTDLLEILRDVSTRSKIESFQTKINRLVTIAKNNNNAFIYYQLGRIHETASQYDKADHYYLKAKENDLLRFRAPEDINNIIRTLAKQHRAILVDYRNNLSKNSPNGLVGDNFMLEHLHPNLQGYFILADSFYQKLKSNGFFGSWKDAVPTSQAWKERPIIAAEEYAGFAKIIQLKSDYPYTDKPKKVVLPQPTDWQQQIGLQYYGKKINWLDMLNQSYKGYLDRRNISMVLKTSEMIADAMPQNAKANFRAGKQQRQEGNIITAKRFFERALLEEPNNQLFINALSSTSK